MVLPLPLFRLRHEYLDQRRGIRQAVGVVIAALLREELHAAAVVLPELDDMRGVVFERHGLVGGAVTRDQEDAGLDGGEQAFGGLQ